MYDFHQMGMSSVVWYNDVHSPMYVQLNLNAQSIITYIHTYVCIATTQPGVCVFPSQYLSEEVYNSKV